MSSIRRVSDLGVGGVANIADGSVGSSDISGPFSFPSTVDISGATTVSTLSASSWGEFTTTASSNMGVRVRAKSDNSDATLQFTDNQATTQWAAVKSTNGVLDLNATTLQRAGSAFVNIVDIPLEVNEWNMGGTSGSRTLSTNVPTTARYIYADVFTTNNSSDHYNIEFSNGSCATAIKNWVDARGQQPSTQFGSMTSRRSVYLTHPGEVDGYTPNYGIWFSGIIIPISGRTLYWGSYGSNGQAWIYLKVMGYSN